MLTTVIATHLLNLCKRKQVTVHAFILWILHCLFQSLGFKTYFTYWKGISDRKGEKERSSATGSFPRRLQQAGLGFTKAMNQELLPHFLWGCNNMISWTILCSFSRYSSKKLDVEQLGLKLPPTWDVGVRFTHNITMLVSLLDSLLASPYTISENGRWFSFCQFLWNLGFS